MELLWFSIVAFMITMYAVLDGFDLGAGVLHLAIARSDPERRTILNAIGPVWDGNEVWLIAGGGTLYFAFPLLYASSFSGFYLPLMIVLWLLILRALGIEFRHQLTNRLWKSFWDVVFSVGSILLTIFLGAALGNVIRGVPLQSDGYFFAPLWTSFTPYGEAGVLDWFTVTMGLVSFFVLTSHGANFIALKTEGVIQARARRASGWMWWGVLASSIAAVAGISLIRPEFWANYSTHAWGAVFPLSAIAGLTGMFLANRSGNERLAFGSSTAFIVGTLAGTAFGMYPTVLPSSTDPALSLTAYTTISNDYGLSVGIIWWTIGIILAGAYVTYMFRSMRGKVALPAEGDGY